MSSRGLLLLVLAALLQVAGNLLLREGVVRAGGLSLTLSRFGSELLKLAQQPLFDIGVILYGAASLVWFGIVSTERLNASYPLLVSLTFILVTVGATVLFKEPMSWQKVGGLAILLVGILLVATAR